MRRPQYQQRLPGHEKGSRSGTGSWSQGVLWELDFSLTELSLSIRRNHAVIGVVRPESSGLLSVGSRREVTKSLGVCPEEEISLGFPSTQSRSSSAAFLETTAIWKLRKILLHFMQRCRRNTTEPFTTGSRYLIVLFQSQCGHRITAHLWRRSQSARPRWIRGLPTTPGS